MRAIYVYIVYLCGEDPKEVFFLPMDTQENRKQLIMHGWVPERMPRWEKKESTVLERDGRLRELRLGISICISVCQC